MESKSVQLSAYSTGERDRVNKNEYNNPYGAGEILWHMYDDGFEGRVFREWGETAY